MLYPTELRRLGIFYIEAWGKICAMEKDGYDLINELGPQNWMDSVAGEAVVFGHLTNNPEIVAKGSVLAGEIRNCRYNNDDFGRVQGMAEGLENLLEKRNKEENSSVFIDEVCVFRAGEKSLNNWEYGFTLSHGRYRINLTMPEYFGLKPPEEKRVEVEKIIQDGFTEPNYEDLKIISSSEEYGRQKVDTTNYYTSAMKLICHRVEFDHEDGGKRGVMIIYYFDELAQALETWVKVRAILNQKR